MRAVHERMCALAGGPGGVYCMHRAAAAVQKRTEEPRRAIDGVAIVVVVLTQMPRSFAREVLCAADLHNSGVHFGNLRR